MGEKATIAASEAALQQRITGVCQIQGRHYGKLEGAPLNMAREGVLRHAKATVKSMIQTKLFTDDYTTPEEECRTALAQEAMPAGEYVSAAVAQYAGVYGAERPGPAWIISPFDTWERNPFYTGPPAPHPEEAGDFEDFNNDGEGVPFAETPHVTPDIPF